MLKRGIFILIFSLMSLGSHASIDTSSRKAFNVQRIESKLFSKIKKLNRAKKDNNKILIRFYEIKVTKLLKKLTDLKLISLKAQKELLK